MAKKKLTLSIDEELLSEVKKLSTLEGSSLSEIVEEYFEGLVFERWVRNLCDDLGLGELEPITELEITKNRPKGLDAAKVVRELREGRLGGISNVQE
jgi:metal-responsive CopG/Arc/MetJ family transcriptional regulator